MFTNHYYKMSFDKDIEQCLQVLHNGGIILYPTDTIWGLGCDATNADAVEKIIALKQRPSHKSFVVLVTDEREVMRHVAAPDLELFIYLQQQTSPTTVIYNGALGLADNVVAADNSVAIRICKDEFCRHLIKRFRKPIVSTSANISNAASPLNFGEISDVVKNGVDYVVEYRQTEQTNAQPSTIIKWENGQPIKLR
jgi:L-threonylcarbamoyladenylate synthase